MNSELTREWRKRHNISVYETGRPPAAEITGELAIVLECRQIALRLLLRLGVGLRPRSLLILLGAGGLAYLEAAYHLVAGRLHFRGLRRRVLAVHEVLGGAVEGEHEHALEAGTLCRPGGMNPEAGHPVNRDLLVGPMYGGPRLRNFGRDHEHEVVDVLCGHRKVSPVGLNDDQVVLRARAERGNPQGFPTEPDVFSWAVSSDQFAG